MKSSNLRSRFAWPTGLSVFASVAWIAIYLADVRALNLPMHLLLAPVLVALTIPFARIPRGRTSIALVLLLVCYIVQKAVDPGLSFRKLLELLLLAYCFSLACIRTSGGCRTLSWGIAGFLLASCLFFLATIWIPSVQNLRTQLYFSEDLSNRVEDSIGEDMVDSDHFQQGGLSIFLHNFGYQVAAAVVIFVALAVYSKSNLRFALYGGAAVSALAMILAGERSVLVAVTLTLFAMLLALRQFGYALGLFLAGLGFFILLTADIGLFNSTRSYNLLSRLQDKGDSSQRFDLQFWALSKIPQYPLGIKGAGDDYDRALARDHRSDRWAPHNGYITRTLFYGWPVAMIIVLIVLLVARAARRTINDPAGAGTPVEAPMLWTTTSVLLNALFHNPSFATFDQITIVLMLTYLVAWDLRPVPKVAARAAIVPKPVPSANMPAAFVLEPGSGRWGARAAMLTERCNAPVMAPTRAADAKSHRGEPRNTDSDTTGPAARR